MLVLGRDTNIKEVSLTTRKLLGCYQFGSTAALPGWREDLNRGRGVVNQIVDKRFDKRQSMRWTLRDAHLLLLTRTRVLNNELDQLLRRRYPAFRKPSGKETAPAL